MEASFKRLPQNIFKESNEARNRWRHRFDTPEKYDHMLKNYFRLITGVDTACKAVWDELEKQGILDETMFIFTTDNGFVSALVDVFGWVHRSLAILVSHLFNSWFYCYELQFVNSIMGNTGWRENGILMKNLSVFRW